VENAAILARAVVSQASLNLINGAQVREKTKNGVDDGGGDWTLAWGIVDAAMLLFGCRIL